MKQKVFWRGWMVQLCCMSGILFMSFFNAASFNIYAPYIVAKGVDYAAWLYLRQILGYAQIAIIFGVGYLAQKIGSKWLMVAGNVLVGITFALLGQADSLVSVGILSICLAISANLFWASTAPLLLAKWYPRKKGVIMGWVTSVTILSTLVMLPLLKRFIDLWGFEKGMALYGCIPIVFAVIEAVFLKETPGECGSLPDNQPMTEEEKATFLSRSKTEKPQWSFLKFFKSPRMLIMTLGYAFIMVCATGLTAYGLLALKDKGVADLIALRIIQFSGFAVFGGSLVSGIIDQKFKTRNAAMIICIIFAVGFIVFAMCSTQQTAGLIIGYYLVAFASGAPNNLSPSSTLNLSGHKDYAVVYKYHMMAYTLVRQLLGMVTAFSISRTGHYTLSFWVCAVFAVIGLILVKIAGDKPVKVPE